MKKIIIIIIAVITIFAGILGTIIYVDRGRNNNNNPTETTVAEDNISFTLEISADGKDKTYKVDTKQKMLGKALVESGYVKDNQSDYGLYIQTVYGIEDKGRTADESKQEWWCVTKSGETVTTGADTTPLTNGDHYELTLKTGY